MTVTDVWTDLVGQEPVVETLRSAVASAGGEGRSMTHAWLFTGPPGSGRSNAALAFAAALQCEQGGCGHCHSCTSARAGSHPDITVITTQGLTIGVDGIREYVRASSLRPALGRWQVLVVEDADRLTDQAAAALLKAIEEPSKHTVWMLCAPSAEDVMITLRSRSRSVVLRTPGTAAIARLLVERDGIEPEMAQAVAAASQGHIGRARGLARDSSARERRRAILSIPVSIHGLGDCMAAAQRISDEATARAADFCDAADERELADLRQAWGVEERGRRPAGFAGAVSALEKDQKRRRTRLTRDGIDGVLLDLLSFCRDVLTVQCATGIDLVNADVAADVAEMAQVWTPESTIGAIDAIVECRESLTANAAPLLALERMMMGLRR
ncbi:DNA polymerase III subunit delta' [Aeromicrobium sp. SMF47]|uniref:DNA polymerase III subunit delta n=1 Tax=Aeromicrobium yanjiei TaxID=2662028 RepID=A0A5Q2MEW2_9ACTN|nr:MULTISPECIES: DNA polymerase III subunit delta' [Aeromicrobium]MRJ75344.1 DNA polymerase III subunit delta' [Aeromicrobium yanjiei]MRK02597.1 DNA polymerase III subunit delta' [Aeromicrobium sp. S22]QGG40201.1 DNA polymerase III subunit delta' [Aeromicrobium yanjiei]